MESNERSIWYIWEKLKINESSLNFIKAQSQDDRRNSDEKGVKQDFGISFHNCGVKK